MLVFDELKKNDSQLRLVALMLTSGFFILFAGLWWVQVVSAREYRNHQDTQAYRTIRLPAVRGKILDSEGRVLAENRARYDLCLYFDDLSDQFRTEYSRIRPMTVVTNSAPFWRFWNRTPTVQTKRASLTRKDIDALTWQARYNVVSRIAAQVGQKLGQPISVDPKTFIRSYDQERALPFPILKDLNADQIARFEEQFSGSSGVDLELQSVRYYPSDTTAGHLLGYVLRDDTESDSDSDFNYYLPDYKGVVGIEAGFDSQLRGVAGEESLLVNNLGYRQSQNVSDAPEPGDNVTLTIDLDIQRAAEKSLLAHEGAKACGAVVVMDVHSGAVLAMVSSPVINPVFSSNSAAYLDDTNLTPQINRATYGNYAPGSIFKPIVGLAALENGLNPDEDYVVQPNPREPNKGGIKIGNQIIGDTVEPGPYKFKRAIEQSSNSYFVFNGLRTGIDKIIQLAKKFHFGEKTRLPTRQESSGIFPSLKRVQESDWRLGDSAFICFGQGQMAVTPIQMAVAYSAIANGGTILWPQLVKQIQPQNPASNEATTNFPTGQIRDNIGVSTRNLNILREAMLGETDEPNGTGYPAFHANGKLAWRVCGKTGTAQRQNERNQIVGWNYWFASFAPYENPKYAVIVMVQKNTGGSGGSVCAPIARDIYEEIIKKENSPKAKLLAAN